MGAVGAIGHWAVVRTDVIGSAGVGTVGTYAAMRRASGRRSMSGAGSGAITGRWP